MRVLVVAANPCEDSFTHAAARAALDGAERAGHEVTLIDLYALGFHAAMTAGERARYETDEPIIDPMVAEHADLVRSSNVLVFVYPTWWGGLPAIMKGWLERTLVPGVAFAFTASGKVEGALRQVRHIVGISTYGSPWAYVKLINDNGRRTLTRALRMSCGRRAKPKWIGLYSMDSCGDQERKAFLDRVTHELERLD